VAETRELLDACVHCGFCLPSCPTYVLWGEEMDSPRGRIHLMNLVEKGEIELDATVASHFDRCLGCLACVPACPSGVRYDILIPRARGLRRERAPRSLRQRVVEGGVLAAAARPRLLRTLAWPLALGVRPFPLAPRVTPSDLRTRPARVTPARGEPRMRAAMLEGCVQRVFFGRVNRAAAEVLAADGCEVSVPAGQGCCGALALHAGQDAGARQFARDLIATFERAAVDFVAVNAAGCGSAMKEYGHLLADDPAWAERARAFSAKVRDVTEVLASLDPRAVRQPLTLRVAYHDACHLAHAQGVRGEPRQLLESIPGVTIAPIAESEICCGSAGIFNLVQPEMAAALGARKAANLSDAAPDVVATSNPGCILQIRSAARERGYSFPVVHIVELLDASIRGQRSEVRG
jgi:glycolate oxidase iron-sulfur subunit